MKPFNLRAFVRPHLLDMVPYSSARNDFCGEAAVFLDANESPFPTPFNRYPDPDHRALREAWAAMRGVEADQILVGNGSDEILDMIYRTFCRPGQDTVLTISPSYGVYKVLAALNDLALKEVPLDGNGQFDPATLLKAAERARLIQLCSPNNPTGNLLDREAVQAVLERFDGPVVIDEAYVDFSGDPGWIGELATYGQLIVIQTMSKAFGMAGIRVGAAFASKEVIDVLCKVKPPYNVSGLSQTAALERLREQEIVAAEVEQIVEERRRLADVLSAHTAVKEVFPSDANFLLIRVENARVLKQFFEDHGVIVRLRSFKPHFEECLRITIGTKAENDTFLTVLDAFGAQ